MTAIETDVDGAGEVGRVCTLAAEGRRAARALSQWCERFALSEPEFQVLWCLRNGMGAGFDQTMLARRLAYSPAQVSSTVERLRGRGWIAQQAVASDRRRNHWHVTEMGARILREMLTAARELHIEIDSAAVAPQTAVRRREAAA